MNDEYCLLKQLGVNVSNAVESAGSKGQPDAAHHSQCRVWTTTVRAPETEAVKRIREELVGERVVSAKTAVPRHADPTGEVLLVKDRGERVEYVVFNSKVPSVWGINRQLTEEKQKETIATHDRENHSPPNALILGEDERAKDAERRHLLRELHRCNMEQAARSKAERARAAQRQTERETAAIVAAQRREREEQANAQQVRRAAQRAVHAENAKLTEEKRRRHAEEHDRMLCFTDEPFLLPVEDGWNHKATARAIQEYNRQRAEESEERRRQVRATDIAAVRDSIRDVEEKNKMFSEWQSQAGERAHSAGRNAVPSPRDSPPRTSQSEHPLGSSAVPVYLEDRPPSREGRLNTQRETMEINRRLAEERKERLRAEREHERFAMQQQLRVAAEAHSRDPMKAYDCMKEQQGEARETARTPSMPPVYFGACREERELRAREARCRNFAEIAQEVARRKEERAEQARLARENEQRSLEVALRAAQAADRSRQQQKATKQASLLKALNEQVAHRNEARSKASPSIVCTTPVVQRVLYRCPVTHQLLPSSAFDFRAS